MAVPGVRAATYDGDTPPDERRWIRDHANVVLTNPDLLHHSLLPGHERWSRFLRSLEYVVVDECHVYRGVFGSHVSAVLRRLRRVAARYGATPTFVLASATVSEPATHASRLIGMPVTAVTDDGSPRGAMTFALWEPATVDGHRRSATTEAAEILAELVLDGVQAVAFARSRAGAEALATNARRRVEHDDPARAEGVAAYRGGYLPAGPARDRAGAARRVGARAGRHQRPRARHRRQRSRRRRDGRLAGAARQPLAAGRAGRALGRGVARGARRRRRPARHLPRAPPGGHLRRTGRGDRHGPAQPARAGPAPRRGRGGAAAGRERPADVRARRAPAARRARHERHPAPPALRVVLGPRGPPGRAHLAARRERRRGRGRGPHRAGAGHRRRGLVARPGAHRCRARAPGRHLGGHRARPRGPGGPRRARRPRAGRPTRSR